MKEKNISDSLREAIVGYYTNILTQPQAEELLEWLGEDEDNRRYFTELEKVWYASGQLSKKEKDINGAWSSLLDKIKENDIRKMPKPELRIGISLLFRVAAAVLLLAVVGMGTVFVFRSPKVKSEVAYFEAFAPKGSRSFITLSDGSTVWLNSGTKLRYQSNFGKEGRDLFLEGEAYFVVAKNAEIPFTVRTSDVCVTAIGTAFNVKAYNEEGSIETTLEKGEVRIDALDNSRIKPESTPVYLKPNQKAVYIKSNKNISVNSSVQQVQKNVNESAAKIKTIPLSIENMSDTKLTTSWKDSRWIFKSEKLLSLKPILERRYDISIIFMDSVLMSYKFTGTLKEESLEQVLKAICLASPIKYEINHNQVIFYEAESQKNQYRKPSKTN
jgi:ferric-dicitrate binding protein FerR (iron transport regulator)